MKTLTDLDNNVISVIASFARIKDYQSLRIVMHDSNIDRDILNPSLHTIPHARANEYLLSCGMKLHNIWKAMSVIISRKIFVSFKGEAKKYGLSNLPNGVFEFMQSTIRMEVRRNQSGWIEANRHNPDVYDHVDFKKSSKNISLKYITKQNKSVPELLNIFGAIYTKEEILSAVIDASSSESVDLDCFDVIDVHTRYPIIFASIMRAVRRGGNFSAYSNIEAAIIYTLHVSGDVGRIIKVIEDAAVDSMIQYYISRVVAIEQGIDLSQISNATYRYILSIAPPKLIMMISMSVIQKESTSTATKEGQKYSWVVYDEGPPPMRGQSVHVKEMLSCSEDSDDESPVPPPKKRLVPTGRSITYTKKAPSSPTRRPGTISSNDDASSSDDEY